MGSGGREGRALKLEITLRQQNRLRQDGIKVNRTTKLDSKEHTVKILSEDHTVKVSH
jgi:hypothetical protein